MRPGGSQDFEEIGLGLGPEREMLGSQLWQKPVPPASTLQEVCCHLQSSFLEHNSDCSRASGDRPPCNLVTPWDGRAGVSVCPAAAGEGRMHGSCCCLLLGDGQAREAGLCFKGHPRSQERYGVH